MEALDEPQDEMPVETTAEAAAAEGDRSGGLTRRAGRGAVWQVLGGLWTSFVALGASAILARLLTPRDFGVVGMALLARGLMAVIADSGATTGLIVKQDLTQEDLSTAFWLNGVLQAGVALIMAASAPLVAMFFGSPELKAVLWALSVTFLLSGLGGVPAALLSKRMQFASMKIVDGAGVLLQYGVAVCLAWWFSWNYWALVVGLIASSACITAGRLYCAGWRPSLDFSRSSARYLLRFALNGLGFSVTNYFSQNVDYLLVGRMLGARLLGFYEFAYRIPHLAYDRLARPVGTVVFPAMSQVGGDGARLAAGYTKSARYIAIVVFPMMAGLAAVARPLVSFLWGDQWLPIVLPLQILCLSGAVRSIITPIGGIFMCRHRPDIPFKCSFLQAVATLACVGGLAWFYGLTGAAVGMMVSSLSAVIPLYLAFRLTGGSVRTFWAALWPPVASSLVVLVVAGLLTELLAGMGRPAWQQLAVAVPAGVVAYAAVTWLFFNALVTDVVKTIKVVGGPR